MPTKQAIQPPHGITHIASVGTSSRLDDPACPGSQFEDVLPVVAVLLAAVVLAPVVLAAVVLAVVLAFLILAAVVVALVVFALAVVVAAEEPVAAEQVAQRLGRQDAAADAEGDLACPGQETLAARSLPAG